MSWLTRIMGTDPEIVERRAAATAKAATAIASLFPGQLSGDVVKLTPPEDAIEAYGWNPWLYAAVRTIGDAVAQIPRKVYRTMGDGSLEEFPGEAQDLLDRPNEWQTGDAFRRAIVSWLVLNGNAYLFKLYGDESGDTAIFKTEKPNHPPERLMLLHPKLVNPVASDVTRVSHYEYHTDPAKAPIIIHPTRMLHIAEFSIEGYRTGTGAGEVLGNTLALSKWMTAFNTNGFRYGGSHQRLIQVFKGQVLKDDSLRRRVMYELRRKVGKGGHEPLIADNDSDFKMLGTSHKDMEFTQLWKAIIQEVSAATGVPPGKLGFLEFANYSNMDAQERGFWVDVARPKLCLVDSFLTEFLMPEYDDSLVVESDLSSVSALQEDLNEAADIATKLSAFISLNGVREFLAEKGVKQAEGPIPGGDVLLTEYRSRIHAAALFGAEGGGPGTADSGSDGEAGDEPSRSAPTDAFMIKAVDDREIDKLDHAVKVEKMARSIKRDLDDILKGWESHAVKALSKLDKATTSPRSKVFTVADLETYEIVPNGHDAQRLVARRARTFQTRSVLQRAAEVLAELGIDASVDVTSDAVRAYLASKVQAISGNWPETVLQRLRDALIEKATAEDLTIAALQDTVRQVMDVELARALTIARTEAIPAFNFGSLAGYEASGVVEKMEWLDAGDSEVRESHRNVEPVVLGERFNVGGSLLRYPGDPEGPPDEIISCRCTVAPLLVEEVSGATQGAPGRAQ